MSEPAVPRIVYLKRWVYDELLRALLEADGITALPPVVGEEKISLHGFELLEFHPEQIYHPLNLKTLPGREKVAKK